MIGSLFGMATGIVLLIMAIGDGDPVFLLIAFGWTGVAVALIVANMRDDDPRRRRASGGGCGGGCSGGCGGD